MRDAGIPPRERLETTSALAAVSLVLGLLGGGWAFAGVALGLLLASLFLPGPTAWAVRGWKTVTHAVAKVVTTALLAGVHLLVVTPTGVLRRLSRRDAGHEGAFVDAGEAPGGPPPESWDRHG
jgi:hypothetical protein